MEKLVKINKKNYKTNFYLCFIFGFKFSSLYVCNFLFTAAIWNSFSFIPQLFAMHSYLL